MKKIALVLATSLCIIGNISIYAQKTEIFQKKNKFGLRQDTKTLVKPQYNNIESLSPDFYAIVNKSGLVGVVDTNGRTIVPEMYDDVKYFGEKIFLVKKDQKWGLINRSSKIILPLEYTGFKLIKGDLCEVKKDNKWGLINKYGDLVLPAAYDDIKPFIGDTYSISINGKKGIVNDLGNVLLPAKYDDFSMMSDSTTYNMVLANKQGLMDYSFKVLLDADYDNIEQSPIGKVIYQNGKIGFYTDAGTVIPPAYSQILFFQPEFGLAVVKIGEKLALVTSKGIVTPAVYENISRFSSQGIAFVEKSGKLMAVNIEGKEMTVQETMNRPQAASPSKAGLPSQVGPPF